MNYRTLSLITVLIVACFAGNVARANNMVSLAVAPTTGVVTLVPRWIIGPNLAGFHFMSQDTGFSVGANRFYSIKNTAIPMGGDITAFTYYVAASGAATDHNDVGSKLTPNSYSALTSADPDVGYGAINFYFIHHKGTTDYFTEIVPGSAVASAVTDLKPMSGPGGPATVTGVSGYFGLTFAAANLGYGLNQFYYFRTDPVTGFTKFGTLDPALLSTSADQFDLGITGHNALTFTGSDVGFGPNKMYYLRLDPITGYTILGTLAPVTGETADIANLGSVYGTLDFVPGDIGFGALQFYATGGVNPTWQSVSFAAIPDRALISGSFTVSPSASSGLSVVLTVVSGSATIGSPVSGVYTVTPTAPGRVTLQASQAGQLGVFESNMLRQSFIVTGPGSDFNADGKADLLWENTVSGDRVFWLMNGTSYGSSVDIGVVPLAWRVAAKADFNGDGKTDIMWENTATGDRVIWLMNGTVVASTVAFGVVPPVWHVAAAADFNGDGQTDIVWENTSTGDRAIWLMNGTVFSSSVSFGVVPPAWRIAGAADFNNDGQNDLVWENTSTGEHALWLMTGTVVNSSMSFGVNPTQWRLATIGDFNGDGHPDFFWENTETGDHAIWLMNGTVFSSAIPFGVIPVAWHLAP